jgi:glycosyltransferase involved in cell wall biosynthesis
VEVPDVSVLTPSLNQGQFIEDNVVSVLGQEGLTIEHIVQDAGSTDGTFDVLRRFGDAVQWVSEPDRGQSDALNKALRRATGRWVAWHNADDFYLPGGLAALVRHGDKVGDDVVYGDKVQVDREGRVERNLGGHRAPRLQFSAFATYHRYYARHVHSGASIMRRSALPSDPWDVDLHLVMDQEVFLKLAFRGARFGFVKYPTTASRAHEDAKTQPPGEEGATPEYWAVRLREYATIRERYGRPRLGRHLHRARKLLTGAYWRQHKALILHGQDIRWFSSEEGRVTFANLVRSCYKTILAGEQTRTSARDAIASKIDDGFP